MVANPIDTTNKFQFVAPQEIPVSLIDPSSLNRHCDDTDADIAELAQTIEENGLLSPVSIRPRAGGRFEIICGERRWRAFRLLERETIPCFVKDLDDTQAQIERIVENYQRRDPSFMEQGEAVAALMKLTDRDVSEVANRLGQSVSWVRRRAKLPNLIPAWREELAKENTPYFTIRNSVEKMEEVSVLPAATQQIILDKGVLRYVKTTKEMRNTIAKHFMNLDAKPWTRTWEKKAFSGSGKKRCDACMRRSDRENALFADPDDANAGKKMCLDPQCWKEKSLSWCRSMIDDNPDIVPIRQGYNYGDDGLTEFFGIKPVSYHQWLERDETEAREGYTAVVGVYVDGPDIGTTVNIWLENSDEDDDGNEDSDTANVHEWRNQNTAAYETRQAFAEMVKAEIAAYLADIEPHATMTPAELADRQIRAACWFGIAGQMESSKEGARIDDAAWNPLAYAWEQTTEHIAEFVAYVSADESTGFISYSYDETDGENSKALCAMFAIPLDLITTKALEALAEATGISQDTASDTQEDTNKDGDTILAAFAEPLTDERDRLYIGTIPTASIEYPLVPVEPEFSPVG